MKTIDMEIAIADYFNSRVNLIVPNISYGMGLHECDLLIITKSNYAYEVEIKVSSADLIRDIKKKHNHEHEKIKHLYFAIPSYLTEFTRYIPERAGIIVVDNQVADSGIWQGCCKRIREAKINSKYRFTDTEIFNVARLGTMRIWTLKQKLREYEKDRRVCQ